MRRRSTGLFIIGAGLLVSASAFIHPYGRVRAQGPDRPLFAGTEVDPSVLRILERSCQNCHSEKTEWPWYSYIAPAGWLLEKDVHQACEHLNMSQWGDYGAGVQRQILTRMSAVVRSRQMPLPRYLLLHPDSKLSDREIARIEAWTQIERRQLASRQLP